jgi:hypothetical protein
MLRTDEPGQTAAQMAASWFGPSVISLVGLLMGPYRLSKRQVTHLLTECFGITMAASTMAASTVVNQQQAISRALAAPVAELEPVVKNEPVCDTLCFALHPAEATRLPGNCWAGPMAESLARTAVVPTPGCNDANSVGAICCAISRRSSNAAATRTRWAGI